MRAFIDDENSGTYILKYIVQWGDLYENSHRKKGYDKSGAR